MTPPLKSFGRRAFIANALVVSFALSSRGLAQGKKLPPSLAKTPELDSWMSRK